MKMTLKNVEYVDLEEGAKEELKAKVRRALAKSAGVAESSVSVLLSQGSVKVYASFHPTPGSSAASSVEIDQQALATAVLQAAKSTRGVRQSAQGEIDITPEVLS